MNTSLPTTPFAGQFSEEHRRLLLARRLGLGLSLKQLGDVLGIHSSTIRKWECGLTTRCHPRHVRQVARFLAGDLDQKLRDAQRPRPAAGEAAACLERLAKAHQLLAARSPQLADELLQDLQAALRKATAKFRAFVLEIS